MTENLLNNNALAALTKQAAPQIVRAIKDASARTGVNFAYLMEQAAAESSFNARAEAKTSSAAGLYQFIESTWLNMVKKHGHKYGMGELASKINDNGKVADQAARNEILSLRKDPEKAALLAAEFAAENKRHLDRHVGGEIGATEMYFAHFMGAGGAAGFLNAMKENPLQTAADLFPKAARANRNVFYDRETGEARTLAGVYEFFDKKFNASRHPDAAPKPGPRPQNPDFMRSYQALKNQADSQPVIEEMITSLTRRPFAWQTEERNASPGWRTAMPLATTGSLLFSPAELMLMASRNLPTDARQEKY